MRKKIRKNLTAPKIDAQCPKPTQSTQHYLTTLPKTYPTLTHKGEDLFCLPDAIAYLNTWGLHHLVVLLAYILLRVPVLIKVFAQKIFISKYPHSVDNCRTKPKVPYSIS